MKQHWTATTIAEALDLLEAATKQLDSQVLALAPGVSYSERKEIERQTPLLFTVDFDMTALMQHTTDHHVFNEQINNG
ncbi:hypothetical protein [Streptomyces scopuliridis]|uniref:hypothetical protein n=1 Tax=Streptomyces scopuliridis TaxID=452529 RepID=UPI003414B313